MRLQDFINTWNGKYLDFDGVSGGQCVDVPKAWLAFLGLPNRTGNGKDWINNARDDCIRFDYSPGMIPQEGDIVSWRAGSPADPNFGHVAVAVSGNASGFTSFDQNWGGAYCHKVNHSYQGVQGWIRPKNYQGGGVDMLTKDAVTVIYLLGFFRNPSAQEYNLWVGKPHDDLLTAINNHPARKEIEARYATVDGLVTKVLGLENKVGLLTAQLQGQNDIIIANDREIADLKKKLAQEGTTAPTNPQEQEAVNFVSKVIGWLRKLFK